MWYWTANDTMVAIGSAVTVDAFSSFRGVMSWISGDLAAPAAATARLVAIAACVATYCSSRLRTDFWLTGS